jgi:cell division protein FtsQ
MRKVLLILKWASVLALFIVVLSFTNSRQEQQFVSLDKISVLVSEDNFVNEKIVMSYLDENKVSFDSTLLSNFKAEELEVLLEKHPSIEKVEVFANQKGNVSITVEQKKAVVRIKSIYDDYYLDEFGKRMKLSSTYTPNLLVVTGEVRVSNHQEIFDFVSIINKSEFWKAQITQLHFMGNEVIMSPRVGDQKIRFGCLVDVKEKLNNLYEFYKQAMPVKGWQAYSDINLKFKNQVVCTKK